MTAFKHIRADRVDGEFWIETPQTETALVALHAVLDLGRQQPRPRMPIVCLTGDDMSGRTSLAARFASQAQRSVACSLIEHAREERDAPRMLLSREATERLQTEKAEMEARARDLRQRVRDFGSCPRICSPAALVPEENLDAAINAALHGDGRRESREESMYRYRVAQAQEIAPTTTVSITQKPASNWLGNWLNRNLVDSPGDRSDDPLRRTGMLLVNRADRLLKIGDSERGLIIEDLRDLCRPVTVVLIGSPALADAIRASGAATQVIHIPAMEPGPVFNEVTRCIFGSRDPAEIQRLYEASGGIMGRLLHIAGLQKLKPPYALLEQELMQLPAPA